MWDEERPKRATTAYLVFLERHRKRMTAANPEAKPKEITKLLAGEWREVSNDEKQKCEEIAAEDKVRHETEMVEYNTGKKKKGTHTNWSRQTFAAAVAAVRAGSRWSNKRTYT